MGTDAWAFVLCCVFLTLVGLVCFFGCKWIYAHRDGQ